MAFKSIIGTTCACLAVISFNTSAATLNIDAEGNLLGATGVVVDGSTYNVSFLDGTCFDDVAGCNGVGLFVFDTSDMALAASNSLLQQVFINDQLTGNNYDGDPTLTNGCSYDVFCQTLTFYGERNGTGFAVAALNFSSQSGTGDYASDTGGFQSHDDTSNFTGYTIAEWTEVSSVPIPAAAWLFGSGLIGLIGVARRKVNV